MDRDLTKLQKNFVDEYLKDRNTNATECVRRAGYRTKYPDKVAYQLLENPRVLKLIEKERSARAKRTNIDKDRVLQEIAKLGFSDITDYLEVTTERILVDRDPETDEPISEVRQLVLLKDTNQIPKDKLAAIAEIKQAKDGSISFKLHDKKGSLELLGRHLSMFTDNLNHQGQVNVQFNIPRPPKGPVILEEDEAD